MFFREPTIEASKNLVTLTDSKSRLSILYRILIIVAATALFLFALNLMGQAFVAFGDETARSIFSVTYNPFISLFIGLLITAIIQSSSTSTSMVVAAVAAGSLDLANAVPMIMGANIGTTLTSTIVSLGFIARRKEFRKAIAAGTVHDFFNILTTLILLPLELYYGILSGLAQWITSFIIPLNHTPNEDFAYGFWNMIFPSRWLIDTIDNFPVILFLSFILLFISIKVLSKVFYQLLIGNMRSNFQRVVFSTPLKSFAWGTGLTALVQSSSVTTPLVVPLVATGKLTLRQAFPYIMGANIGTTFTALLAALFHSNAAISLAVAHLLFNLIGVLLFFPFHFTRNIPIRLASKLGKFTIANRLVGFLYILITFFFLPFALIYFNRHAETSKAKERLFDKPAVSVRWQEKPENFL
jgi:sodium-dependent phosphate cotransporter